MGRDYVIDHCISRLNLEAEDQLYKTYITDLLRFIAGGIASKPPARRYIDILNDAKSKTSANKNEEKDAEEIISNLKDKLDAIGRSGRE